MVLLVCAWPAQAPLIFQRNYIRNKKHSLRIDIDVEARGEHTRVVRVRFPPSAARPPALPTSHT